MGSRIYVVLAVLLACALSACSPPEPAVAATAVAPTEVPAAATPPSSEDFAPLQAQVAEFVVPAVVYTQDLVQSVAPVQAAEPVVAANPTSVRLIVKWEIGSPAQYTRRYERPVWPKGASGVTWGIGNDGGHQSRTEIARDWREHPQVDELVRTAGVVGEPAKALTAQLQHVRTPYPLAEQVFIQSTLPRYSAGTRRAFGPGLDACPEGVVGALEDQHYNRGGSMAGTRNAEKREIRDHCLLDCDASCVAAQLRAMKRLWPEVRGLRDRREDEARAAEGV